MTWRNLRVAAAVGFGAAFVIAAWITFFDWRLNPGGIFRDSQGTNWSIVLETGWSWFFPVAIAATALALVVVSVFRRRP